MKRNAIQDGKNFTASLISSIPLRFGGTIPSRADLEVYAEQFARLSQYEGELKPVIDDALIAIDTRMGAGTSLIDVEAEHDEEWVFKRGDIKWTYADAYEKYLQAEGWHQNVVRSLSDVSAKILGHLQDPKSEGAWDRRGLVIGHVQSGKTANYMGVIARAADAGYKFIIVIAGVHNNLRKQTQERIDEGFVGRSSDPENRIPLGVGLDGRYPHPATLTTIIDDFNKRTASQSGWRLNDFNKPIVIVIKKNVHTLKALHKWLKEINAKGEGKDKRISDVPMLMIDDEADNASINTKKEELDPTKTNAMIRSILGLFDKSCYVGYTATPFANIFINPDVYDEEAFDDLFPRDFIYCLDAPNTYFGPNSVFLDDDRAPRVLLPITDCEEYLPFSHKKEHDLFELPPSLYRAINQFVIVRAIRNLRGHKNKHCSMMINVSRFVHIQRSVREFISVYENKLRAAVKANYAMPEAVSRKNEHMRELQKVFDEGFSDCEFVWSEVKTALSGVFDNLRLFVVNSKSDEALDYKKYEKSGHGLTAIAIGGLSLSRGLTIEGLCVSYMYRNTRMYDTLMQMGRWFGYRPGYEDLCRVHLAPESIDWYAHIADASEELRQQIKRMRRDGLSPRQFGLYVEAHPDSLLVTAANKMRSGESVLMRQNFSGRLIETYLVPTSESINAENERLITDFLESGFGQGEPEPTKKGWIVRDVPVTTIEDFLLKFQMHPQFAEKKSSIISYLQTLSDRHPLGDVLFISVDSKSAVREKYRLGAQERASARPDSQARDAWHLSKDRVASRGDEKLGLSESQIGEAIRLASEDEKSRSGKPSDIHYRMVRKKPLLMLHVLGPVGSDSPNNRVPALGVSFPAGYYDTEIKVVVNRVWLDRMSGSQLDTLEEEDDYDD